MVNVKVFHAKEGTIKIDASGDVTLSSSTVIDTAFASATAITTQFKDFSIKCPVADVDKIDFIAPAFVGNIVIAKASLNYVSKTLIQPSYAKKI